jgi:hypothetical protein
MSDDTTTPVPQPPAEPHPALRSLDRLVGTWTVSGPDELRGQVTYEWMEGGFFLVQHVDLDQAGQRTRGVEYIGHDEETGSLRSHYFGTGQILEYVYEVTGDTLTIWFGAVGSPASFTGTFSDDGTTNTGRWSWPGGGYDSTITRVQ